MDAGRIDKGLTNPDSGKGAPPALQFRYNFNAPFVSVCEAFLKKWNWEPANRLTTIERVEQLDDDRVVVYRRYDAFNAPFTSWEQIILNRANQSIEADVVGPNPNGTMYSVEKTVLTPSA